MNGEFVKSETRRQDGLTGLLLDDASSDYSYCWFPPFNEDSPMDEEWWMNTSMDKDGDFVHDAIWIAAQNNQHDYLDEDGRISVIVDFDHTPTEDDEEMLSSEVDFELEFRYWLIDSIAGTVELEQNSRASRPSWRRFRRAGRNPRDTDGGCRSSSRC